MAQRIVNIKAGQKFIIVDVSCGGFEMDCIVEALSDRDNVYSNAGYFKWIGGYKPEGYDYKIIELTQNKVDLKRYKGKIK